MSARTTLFAAPLVAAICGCSTRVPIAVVVPNSPVATGWAYTTGYTGSLTTGGSTLTTGGGPSCSGNYTGALGSPTVPIVLQCGGGQTGSGTAIIENGALVSAIVRFRNGSEAIVRQDNWPATALSR